MFCIKCGTENPEYAIFCSECGKKLKEFGTEKTPKIGERMGTSGPGISKSVDLEYSYGLPILHLVLFNIFTFGLYSIYWFYRNWKHLKAHKNLDISPGWRTVGLFVPVVGIIMAYEQFRDIKNFAEETGIKSYSSPGLLTLGLVVLGFLTARLPDFWWILTGALSLSIPVYVQYYLNKYWFKEQAGIPWKKGFSNTEIILMIISGGFIGLIILGLLSG